MCKRDQTIEEFRKEQKELDVLLLQAAMEEDRQARQKEKEKQGIVTQTEICLFCNLHEMFTRYA